MKSKYIYIIFFIPVICLLFCGSVIGANQGNIHQGSNNQGSSGHSSSHEVSPDKAIEKPILFDGFLYFAAAEGGYLKALAKQFPSTLDSHGLGNAILWALMAGPPTSALAPTFPADTKINALFISENGNTWVDLGIRDGRLKEMDTISELLAVYSLVNSLALNIPEVKQVKILVNGSDVPSLGGHVSLEYFYKTNMLIVK
ncbi:MAG: hypothetical protein B6230_03805 [Desulfobacteraceae bacterium 4572_89]|nr:MAG: hypothetical protein B6230_03805 [Desulfobacteraceae bacterium 4572_89]